MPCLARFDMMMSYGDLGPFLSVFSIISLILYFVTRFAHPYLLFLLHTLP
jgi:hypothetical protein